MNAALESLPQEWLQKHPVLPLPSRQKVEALLALGDSGLETLKRELQERFELIQKERQDPLRYGYEPDCWKDVRRLAEEGFDEIAIFGANREGKTELLAKLPVEDMCQRKCEWAFFHNTAQTSIHQQQRRIFKMLPPEWRAKATKGWKVGQIYLKYAEATGFSNDVFILPQTGATGYFFNYLQKPEVWEGPEYDGMWFDEKVTLPILETSRFRRGKDRRLQIFVTFTPKWGYTATVANILAGARIVETRPAPMLAQDQVHIRGCPKGHMPYIMHGRRERTAIIFFHNQMNPYGAGREVARELEGAPKSRVMIRAYGWAEKGVANALPKFGPAHIITRARWEELAKGAKTPYLASDPAGARNWFFQYWDAMPNPAGGKPWVILHREWPDKKRYEDWALSPAEVDEADENSVARRNDWRPGPAQRLEAGRSIASYKALLLELEGWSYDAEKKEWKPGAAGEKIFRRVMDPKFGGTPAPSAEEGETIIDLMAEEDQRDSQGRVMPAMEWEPAPGSTVDETIQMLADAMDWDESKPLSVANCPRLYVVEDCEQTITAFREFTTAGTLKDALKDPIDAARYFIKADCDYIEPKAMRAKRGGYW